MRLILASTSPRRREILALLGLPFEVIAPQFIERSSPDISVADEVVAFALGKARSVRDAHPHAIVIGSDTMISLDGEKIGKPANRADAARILRLLSGRLHRIYTSVAMFDESGGAGMTAVEIVAVEMRKYTEAEIESYVFCDESYDKAGAYSIQGEGSKLVKAIRGDYLAAVGMPLKPIAEYLKARGVAAHQDIEQIYADKSYLNWHKFA